MFLTQKSLSQMVWIAIVNFTTSNLLKQKAVGQKNTNALPFYKTETSYSIG